MPKYEYHCPANGAFVEVSHSMRITLGTWGEVCELAERPMGATAPGAPVERVLHGGILMVEKPAAGHGGGSCCGGSGCHGH